MSTGEPNKIKGVALAMIARNAAKHFAGEAGARLTELFDEIVIGVDLSSTDYTMTAATAVVSKVARGAAYAFSPEEFAMPARNRGLSLVQSPWAFVLDTDEKLDQWLVEWLLQFDPSGVPTDIEGFRVLRKNYVDDKMLEGEVATEKQVRLLRPRYRYQPDRKIHETLSLTPDKIRLVPISASIIHSKTSKQQQHASIRYTTEQIHRDVTGNQPICLNIGCGNKPMKGFINIDGDPENPNANFIWDFTPQMAWNERIYPYPGHLPWPDNTVDEIVAHHVLEHFIYHHNHYVVRDWCRMLKPGGRIDIIVPDLDQLVEKLYLGQMNYLSVIQLLYGGQFVPGDKFSYHLSSINESWLKGQLITWGCDPKSLKRLKELSPNELHMEAHKL